jgi:hypothetical protein
MVMEGSDAASFPDFAAAWRKLTANGRGGVSIPKNMQSWYNEFLEFLGTMSF